MEAYAHSKHKQVENNLKLAIENGEIIIMSVQILSGQLII